MIKYELQGAIRELAYKLVASGEEAPQDYYYLDGEVSIDTELALLLEFEEDTKKYLQLLKRFKCTDTHHDHTKPQRMMLLLINIRITDLLEYKEAEERERAKDQERAEA